MTHREVGSAEPARIEGPGPGPSSGSAAEQDSTTRIPWAGRDRTPEFGRREWILLAITLTFYLATRLVGIERFPVYFFCDEAVHGNLAEQLVRDRFRVDGVLLPPYFRNDARWCLSLSVYIHALPVALFGKSVSVVRTTSSVVSMLGVAAVAFALRRVFDARFWWASVLLLAATPVWFVHSRTAFESAMMASFYGCFLGTYLLYRCVSPRWLSVAICAGAATFYAYSSGQGVMAASGLLLLVADWRYHTSVLRRAGMPLWASIATAVTVAIPYLRFRLAHPSAIHDELATLNSYWLSGRPFTDKLASYLSIYLKALDPRFWFAPQGTEFIRHVVQGMGLLHWVSLPLVATGLVVAVLRFRSSAAHRAVLLALFAVPVTTAVVAVHPQRIMALIVPATILAILGLDTLARPLLRRTGPALAGALVCVALVGCAGHLLGKSLCSGATWWSEYGLYGLQWGAPQLFGAIREDLTRSPRARFQIDTTWANNPGAFSTFFLDPEQETRVQFTNFGEALVQRVDLASDAIQVVPAEQLEELRASGKVVIGTPARVVKYPDGRPGFVFTHVGYVPNIDSVFARERESQRTLVVGEAKIGGQTCLVRHSALDIGSIGEVFDGSVETLARGAAANPFVVEIDFPTPRLITAAEVTGWLRDVAVTARLAPASGGTAIEVKHTFSTVPKDSPIKIGFPAGVGPLRSLRIEILSNADRDFAHIHVQEITLN